MAIKRGLDEVWGVVEAIEWNEDQLIVKLGPSTGEMGLSITITLTPDEIELLRRALADISGGS
ncbi:MAG TPA: hypothetical protein VK735_39775 [Pseudonocardia sp.]|uniref:hypothetical protein n=1 Tax=Pseudonocardia sp. TaxID=60912 RepID=UPI002B87BF5D|nr:hypothetical protein [Pseudonocardia sp.]HTF53623.1 hypothetical protein [Pseudonocardia sp.]